jgi:hypothetical protein
VKALQRQSDGFGCIVNSFIGERSFGTDEVGKYPSHAAIGNEVGDDGNSIVGLVGDGADEISESANGTSRPQAMTSMPALLMRRWHLIGRKQARSRSRHKNSAGQIPNASVHFVEG